MQINKPPSSTSSSGVPVTGGSASPDKTTRTENPLAQLIGQVVNAQVLQSKAVQIATAQAALLQAGIAARLTSEQRDQKTPASTQTPPTTTSATPSSNTSTAITPNSTAPTQTQYQTTLQIGNERVVVLSEQPLPAGAQVMLKVSSAQAIQLLEQPPAAPPKPVPDIAGNLLNTMLRQALPLQQPVAKLLATIASDLLLLNGRNSTTPGIGAGNTNSSLASPGTVTPAGLAPAIAATLKPLLAQILNAQLTVENVTEPDMLRAAVTNSGLFREARLLQWAQALLKQFPDLMTRGAPLAAATSPAVPGPGGSLTPAAALLQSAAQTVVNPGAASQGSALAHASASILTPQSALIPTTGTASASAANQIPASQATAALQSSAPSSPTIDSTEVLEAKQVEMLRTALAASGNTVRSTLHDAVDKNADAGNGDVDALRNELLKALSAKAQKNQPAFTAQTTNASTTAAVAADNAKTVAGTTTAAAGGSGVPVNAKTATSTLSIDASVGADTKTTLEKLVSVTSQQLLESSGHAANVIEEEQVLAILRQLPMAQELHTATTRSKPQNDDDQWLLQLLRSSFGALKHLQLQQATNLNAAPSAQHGGIDNPVAPLQIELPILVAQQWHSVNIEIDRRAPDSRPEGNPNERSWRVTLRFELPQLGIIVTQLNLSGVHVNATLWAEKQATCAQLQQQLKALSDRLGKVGAHVTTLDVRHGQPPSAKTRIEQRLIDIRT